MGRYSIGEYKYKNVGRFQRVFCPQWRKFTFSGGGGVAKPPKFPTKLSNFRHTPPPFALEKTVFSPLLGQNFREGGGRPPLPPPTKISATVCPQIVEFNLRKVCRNVCALVHRLDTRACALKRPSTTHPVTNKLLSNVTRSSG